MVQPVPTRSAPRKRGRPEASHRGPDGTEYPGLSHHASGRWRISSTGERFSEPDELLAIARYQRVMAEVEGRDVVLASAVAAADAGGGAGRRHRRRGQAAGDADPRR